jgi:hypothetical protein
LGDRYFIWLVVLTAIAGYIWIYAAGLAETPLRSDGFEYYVYLPAVVIHHDPTLERFASDCCGGTFPGPIGIWRWPSTGRLIDRHTMGVAILVLPFFLVGHWLTLWANLPPDGFSLFYTHASGIASVFYLAAGLSLLKCLLRRYFSASIVLLTLVTIVWGTNLYHYATFDSLFSHVFSFFLLCCLLQLTVHWHTAPSLRDSFAIGLVAGLLVLVRPTNALFLLVFPLYGLVNRDAVHRRLSSFAAHWRHILVIVATASVIQWPQLALYHWAAGSWFVNPYGGQRFHFGSPKIVEVLFSTQKGLFFWSPVLLVSVIGLAPMLKSARPLALATFVIVPMTVYVIASWDDWQFGGSYGHRAFTDLLPLLAFSMGAGYDWLTRRHGWNIGLVAIAGVGITLSVIQMIQYWLGIIPYKDTTWAIYRSVFLRFAR